MSSRRKIITNTLYQLIGKIITAGSTFAITIILARSFGLEGYGEFVKITTYIAFYLLIVDFGFNAVAIPLMSTHDETEVFSHLLLIRFFFGFFLAIVSPMLVYSFSGVELLSSGFTDTTRTGILILSTTIFFQGVFLSGNAVFQKNLSYHRSVISGALGSLTTLLLLLAIFFVHGGLILSLVAFALGYIVTAVTTIFLIRPFVPLIRLSFSLSIIKSLLLQSLPLGLALILNLLYLRANTFILATTRSTIEVGIFGLAYKFFEFFLTVPTFFMNSVYPVFIERKGSIRELQQTTVKAFGFLLIAALVLVIVGNIVAPFLVLVKEDFLPSVLPFRMLVSALPFFFLSSLSMWLLIALERRKLLLAIYGVVTVLSLLLNLAIVPQFGYLGAASITILSEAVVLMLTGSICLRILLKGKQSEPIRLQESPGESDLIA